MVRMMLVAAALMAGSPAVAQTIELDLPGKVERQTVSYACSDGVNRKAEYINAGANSLAVVTMDGGPLVFAGVMSGSGARYAAGPYEWWSKGEDVTLIDQMADEGAEPVTCKPAKA